MNLYEKQTISNKPYDTFDTNLVLLWLWSERLIVTGLSVEAVLQVYSLYTIGVTLFLNTSCTRRLQAEDHSAKQHCLRTCVGNTSTLSHQISLVFSELYQLVHNMWCVHKNVFIAAKTWLISLFNPTHSGIYIC